MTAPSPALSPVLGNQRPRLSHLVDHGSSAGQEAIELAAMAGLVLDDWQAWCLTQALGERPDGRWSAFEVGIIVGRQNGKSVLIEARELAGLFLFGEELIIHSAHQYRFLSVYTPICTINGWTTMGALQTGDRVFAPDGTPTTLIAHPPSMEARHYKITLDDGEQFIAGASHLWAVTRADGWNARDKTDVIASTQEMYDKGVCLTRDHARVRSRRRWRIACAGPLQFPGADLPVDPWLLGAWLGDVDTRRGTIAVSHSDLPYMTGRLAALGESVHIGKDGDSHRLTIHGLSTRLKALGVIGDKHIPERYLIASERQRRELLAGIMDTSGTVSGRQVAIAMTGKPLMADTLILARSLGYKATMTSRSSGVKDTLLHKVRFSPRGTKPFGMPRKNAGCSGRNHKQFKSITAIEPVARVESRCITVDHPSGCYLAGEGFTITHNTAEESFRRMCYWIERTPEFDKRVARIRTAGGEEGIELIGGKRIRYIARSRTAGRGFTGDLLVWDEAMVLDAGMVGAALPTLSARPNPQVWYAASGGIGAKSTQLAALRRRGMDKDSPSPRLFFAEWSIDAHNEYCEPNCAKHDDPGDITSVAKANPSLGIRISAEYIENEREAMRGNPGEFERERLSVGQYPVPDSGWLVIPESWWRATSDNSEAPPVLAKPIFAIDANPARSASAIGVCGERPDGRIGIEIADYRGGTRWIIERAKELNAKYHPAAWVIDPRGAAGALITELRQEGIAVTTVSARDVTHACGRLFDGLRDDTVWHLPQKALQRAVAGAEKRELAGAWAWDRRNAAADISPLMAVTLALWGHTKFGHEPEHSAIRDTVHFDVNEIARLYEAGVYGWDDIVRFHSMGVLDTDGIEALRKRGIEGAL